MSDEQLKVTLTIIDKLSKGLHPPTIALRKFAKEGGQALAVLQSLQRSMNRPASVTSLNQQSAAIKNISKEAQRAYAQVAKLQKGLPRSRSSNRRTSAQNRQEGLFGDIVEGGAGLGLLNVSRKGTNAAMTKQEALTDLRNSIIRFGKDGSTNLAELNSQMMQFDKIGDELGNKLPGTTAQFLALFSTMRQRGIETTTILEGAGEAAALLSIANKEDTQTVGANLAQFGALFELKGEEYKKAANLLSKIRTSKGLGSDELIEASKYFGGRTGKALGVTGLEGAEQTTRFMAFLRQYSAMEGGQIGTAGSAFFRQLIKQKDDIAELETKTGTKLSLFDKKGNFKGLENAVKEFGKLKGKLSDEQMLAFGNKIAGDEGAAVFQTLINNADKWQGFNDDINGTIGLMQKTASESENLKNKIEALTGSVENLGAATFGSVLKPLSVLIDKSNSVIGFLTEVAKAHPNLSLTVSALIALNGAALTLSRGSSLLGFIGNIGNQATTSSAKVGGLRSKLLSTQGLYKATIAIGVVGFTIDQILEFIEAVNTFRNQTVPGLDKTGQQQKEAHEKHLRTLEKLKKPVEDNYYQKQAKETFNLLQAGNRELEYALDPSRMGWGEWLSTFGGGMRNPFMRGSDVGIMSTDISLTNPQYRARIEDYNALSLKDRSLNGMFSTVYDRIYSEETGARHLQKRAPLLSDSNVMTSFRKDVLPTLNLSNEMRQHFEKMLQLAFPQSFSVSTQQLATGQTNLSQTTNDLSGDMMGLKNPLGEMIFGVQNVNAANNNLANATNEVANRIRSLSFQPPSNGSGGVPVPKSAIGSIVQRDGLVHAHRGNVIFPASLSRRSSGDWLESANSIREESLSNRLSDAELAGRLSGGSQRQIVMHNNIHLNLSGSENPKKVASDVVSELVKRLNELEERLNDGDYLATKVVYAASRDDDRT